MGVVNAKLVYDGGLQIMQNRRSRLKFPAFRLLERFFVKGKGIKYLQA